MKPRPVRHATRRVFLVTTLTAFAATAQAQSTTPAALLIRDGDSIAFLGDSITASGWSTPGGYVRLVVDGLAKQGVKVTPIPAGVGGNKSNDMLARLDRDVLSKSPTWLTVSCGVNDVWHGNNGVDLDSYKKNITAIVDRAKAENVKVLLLTATVIGEEPNANNIKLVPYNDFLRGLAKERNLPLADLNALCHAVIDSQKPTKESRILTVDGVHMNPDGNVVMAKGMLAAMGLSPAEIDALEETWLTQKDSASLTVYPYDPRNTLTVTLAQYRAVDALARQNGTNASELYRSMWLRALAKAVEQQKDAEIVDSRKLNAELQAQLLRDLGAQVPTQLPVRDENTAPKTTTPSR